jgi:glutamate receptor, ionotropic, plant
VADLSRAILNLTESDELNLIERKWFGDAEGCAAQSSPFTSDSLSFSSFWGLFLITGATSLLCCVVHLVTFLVANRRPIRELASHRSWRGRFCRFLKLIDDKDLTSHTFRAKDAGAGSVAAGRSSVDPGASPAAVAHNGAGSPSSVSNATCMSEWSLETARQAHACQIELAAAGPGQAEDASSVTVALDPDGVISEQMDIRPATDGQANP